MKHTLLHVLRGAVIASLAVPAVLSSEAQPLRQASIFVDRMDGFETVVEQALKSAELPFEFTEEKDHPEMKAELSRMRSFDAEVLYRHKLGRTETHRLELRDLRTKKVIAWHAFRLDSGENARSQAAAAFAQKVRTAWARRR